MNILLLSSALKVSENRGLRRISGPKMVEIEGGCGKLYNEKLHSLCSSPNIIRVIKSRRMRWVVHVRDEKCIQNFSWNKICYKYVLL
jgi:hypothetical protein